LLAIRVSWGHAYFSLVSTYCLSDTKSLSQHVDQRSIDIVDTLAKLKKLVIAHPLNF